ncbi:MAG: putative glycolipid-binding domain-containing protein [Actinobacteria bacterium]|nr:putative glycolipid-binding domain-containing protein [Actinomycetota bacterium]
MAARKGRRMVREVMWWAWDGPGLGHLRLAVRDSGVAADGVVLGVTEGRTFRLAYEVRCDAYWRVRAARVGLVGEPPKTELLSDGEGNWTGPDGQTLPYLAGCKYIDISETPFTNTLPIRRLDLAPGEYAEITVAYFDGTELQPWPESQHYACLEKGDEGGLYRFLSLDGGFTADLPVDSDGLVVDYPGLFRRTLI